MPTREYLATLVKLLKSLTTDRDRRQAMGSAGGSRGPKGIEAEDLIGAARVTPRTVRAQTEEELFDLNETLLRLAAHRDKKRRRIFANAHNFVRDELLRRGYSIGLKLNVDVGDVHVNQLMPEIFDDEISMPFPNEHACRIASPGQFSRFRRNNNTSPHTIIGFKSGGGSSLQAFRYPTASWTAEKASTHCGSHNGSFEAAAETKKASELGPGKVMKKTVERDDDGRITKVREEIVDA